MDSTVELDLDKVISLLIDSKGKDVKLAETDIRALCIKSR